MDKRIMVMVDVYIMTTVVWGSGTVVLKNGK